MGVYLLPRRDGWGRVPGVLRGLSDWWSAQSCAYSRVDVLAVAGDVSRDDPLGVEQVAAVNVDGHQVRPVRVGSDLRRAGVAGCGDLGRVVGEVLGADARAAQHVCTLADLGWANPQHQRQPPGAGVHPGLVADPLEPVA